MHQIRSFHLKSDLNYLNSQHLIAETFLILFKCFHLFIDSHFETITLFFKLFTLGLGSLQNFNPLNLLALNILQNFKLNHRSMDLTLALEF
jgi:hypothetical protein